jgi:hypothetical protein
MVSNIDAPLDSDAMNELIDPTLHGQMTRPRHSSVDAASVKAKSMKAKPSKATASTISRAKSSKKVLPPEHHTLDTINNDNIIIQRSVTKWLVIEIIKLPLRILSKVLMLLSLLESTLTGILDRI